MNPLDIEKAFVSEHDKFLFTFDHTHERSASQLKEQAKHHRIAMLRDNADSDSAQEKK